MHVNLLMTDWHRNTKFCMRKQKFYSCSLLNVTKTKGLYMFVDQRMIE